MEQLDDKQLMDELNKRMPDIYDKILDIKDLDQTIQELNKKLIESEKLKTNFISSVSNEIINPFASILALSTEILLVNDNDKEKIRMLISMIHTESFFLNFQFKNIFIAAEIEAGEVTLEIQDIDVNHFLSNIMNLFDIEIAKRNINFVFERNETFTFRTDPSKLSVIFLNLLSNAVKFSYNNRPITLSLYKEEGELVFIVKNEGVGIADHEKKSIFNRFSRNASKIGSVYRGNGLGLSIVNALLELFNGRLTFESVLTQGATFTVMIPESQLENTNCLDCTDFFVEDGII